MAILLSEQMLNGGLIYNGSQGGQTETFTTTVRIPSGSTPGIGDVWKFLRTASGVIVRSAVIRSDALDDGSPALTAKVGYSRPVRDPALAYNATTNPYIDGAIATADDDFIEAAVAAPFQAGGVLTLEQAGLTVTSQSQDGLSGIVDWQIEVAVASTAALSADAEVKLTLELLFNNEQNTANTLSMGYNSVY